MLYQHILVPIDGSETSMVAMKEAIKLGKALNSKITVVQVMALDPFIADAYVKTGETNELIERTRTYLLDILEQAKQQFSNEGITVETKLLEGFIVHEEIIQAAQDLNADLIVMGSHGRTGVRKLVLGSVAQKVLGESHIPVLIVR
ncbi:MULTISPECIES: universal stress protein [Acinetobacter]|jgi:nucleotide-binding universal stress UspA family protein|uniref:Universal stress protein n=1 Tax=Acinetobacter pittii TaxID=48296 RepID=A0A0R0S1K6_ACIPI|nr:MULTISPECIES: universal stress protein [Acinetobacter]EXS25263.1 universal stress family protein [Acinetobacter baumannii 573719]KRI53237.1 universal stress protein [Acinetobacter pittii]MBJ8470101.1 universal stress protein [Acinetobacter pittii]MBJ8500566.1 universal stress protein [Acinetobacter pittii]MBJ9891308.1 universal stress protein [Acinetobacter pittii]